MEVTVYKRGYPYLCNILAENEFYYVQMPDDLAKLYDQPDDAFTIDKYFVSAFTDYEIVSQITDAIRGV